MTEGVDNEQLFQAVGQAQKASLKQSVIDYYNQCWLSRFNSGHNPKSLAMHMGFFDEKTLDNDQAKLNMNSFLAHELGLPANQHVNVLDAGCGVGGTCFYIAENFPETTVTGVNFSEEQVATAERFRNSKNSGGRVEFVVADYSYTGLEANSFDLVYLVESLCHAEVKLAVYTEAMRVLKPAGKLVILDYVQTEQADDSITAQQLVDFEKGWAVKQYVLQPDEELKSVGFEKVCSQSLTSYVLPGIRLSSQRSAERLKAPNGYAKNSLMISHFKACVSLQELVEKNVIDYRIISACKPS